MNSLKKIGIVVFLGIFPAIILYFWFSGSGYLLSGGKYAVLYAFGRLAGLLLAYQVLLQLLFIGRVRWVERVFGLDKLIRAHRVNGLFVPVFLVLHPIFLVIGAAGSRGVPLTHQFFSFFMLDDVSQAVFAHFLFLGIVVLTYIAITKKMRYETWYAVHLLLYAAILLSFGHQLEIGGDFAGSSVFTLFWYALYAFFIGNFVLFRFLFPIWYFAKNRFLVSRVFPENENVTSFYIEGKALKDFPARAGQFLMLRFLRWPFILESHPFSISAVPNGDTLRISVKKLGDFTGKIRELPAGTAVFVDGPHGIFTADATRKKKVLMLAGGIGITPVRSVSEELLRRGGYDVRLVYSAKSKNDFVFRGEFEKLESIFPNFRAIYLASGEAEGWGGEIGILDAERLHALVPDFAERECYICGPVPFLNASKKILREGGVRKSAIHFEQFNLL